MVLTVIEPSIKSSSAFTPYSFKALRMWGNTSFIYFSRYWGNNTAKELSSSKDDFMSPFLNSSILNLSMVGSLSHGLSLRKRLLFGIESLVSLF